MKIRIRASFAAYLLLLALVGGIHVPLCLAAALLAHEAAHIAVGLGLGEAFERVELTPFGGVITYASGKSGSKGMRGMLVAAAGPLANYLLLCLFSSRPAQQWLSQEALRAALSVNAAMLLVNLLPVLPLDGGRIVFCLGYYLFPVSRLITVLTAFGMAAGTMLLALGLYGMAAMGIANLSLFFVGSYLIGCAWMQRTALISENIYTVLQERSVDIRHCRRSDVISVSMDTPLYGVASLMRSGRAIICLAEDNEEIRVIGERTLVQTMLRNPAGTIEEAYLMRDREEQERFAQK